MRNKILLAFIAISVVVGITVYAYAPEKVTICHFTGSSGNPWVRIVTNPNAINGHFYNNGTPKSGHEEDILFEGEWDCPEIPYCGDGQCNNEETCSTCETDCGSCGGGGGGCILPSVPLGFDVQSGVLNDNILELSWDVVPNAHSVIIRYSETDGDWQYPEVTTENDGQHSLGGLVNGIHYWLQMRAVNDCGNSPWTGSIDPLP